MLAEEAVLMALRPKLDPLVGDAVASLLSVAASGETVGLARKNLLERGLDQAREAMDGPITTLARRRARALNADHTRLRQAGKSNDAVQAIINVTPVLPVDVVGLYVLSPFEV